MIVLKLSDGLGNQMFQYAFGRQLQEYYQTSLLLETARYRSGEQRKVGLQNLSLPLNQDRHAGRICRFATPFENMAYAGYARAARAFAEKCLKIPSTGRDGYSRMIRLGLYMTQDSIRYYPFEKSAAPVIFVRGFFQSEKYFHDIAPAIRRELRVKEAGSGTVRLLGERMAVENSVCVHIRRGDYIGHPKFDVCGEAYYRRAVEAVCARVAHPALYVFSNTGEDLSWIRGHYDFLADAHFVREGSSEFDDLYLMYHCRHHIISNSTFSWWGAYLKEGDGLTLCPSRWNNTDQVQDIELADWIRVDV